MTVALRARRLLAAAGEDHRVIDGGWVVVEDGLVRDVGDGAVPGGIACSDLGEVVLAPGLVNAHTHLELSHAPHIRSPRTFSDFLWSMRDYRPTVDASELGRAARDGAMECLRSGTTAVIDLVTCVEAARSVAETGLQGVVCAELLGLDPRRVDGLLLRAQQILGSLPLGLGGGLFLHAPYTVSGELLARARLFARQRGDLLLATHLLESPDEIQLLTERQGPMADELSRMGLLDHVPPPRTIEEILSEHAPEGTRLVHLAAMPGRLASLLPRGTVAVLCPRSNATLGVGPAPFAALRKAGVGLALGTDSRASAPSLDMRDEIRAACDAYGIAPREAFAMATLGGALALADPRHGRIAAGCHANLVAVEDRGAEDAYEAFVDPTAIVRRVDVVGRPRDLYHVAHQRGVPE